MASGRQGKWNVVNKRSGRGQRAIVWYFSQRCTRIEEEANVALNFSSTGSLIDKGPILCIDLTSTLCAST